MKKAKEIISNALIYLTIYSTNFLFIMKIEDPDLFFDLRSAKDILTYGLDFKDHMTIFSDLKYLYHHWLYDLIIYPIFNLGGYPLVLIFTTTLFFIFSAIFYKALNKKINNKWLALFLTIVLSNTMGKYFYPRVRAFSLIIMLLEFICINKLYNTGKIKYTIISFLLAVLMVNMHFPMWILIPVFYLPYIVQMIIKAIKDKYNIKLLDKKFELDKCKNSKLFIISFILILLSCLISPYGFLPYIFPFKISNEYENVYMFIGEMTRTKIYKKPVAIVVYLIGIITVLFKKKIKLSDLFYLLGIGILGLMASRNLSILYFIFYLILIPMILEKNKIVEKINNSNLIKKIKSLPIKPIPIYIVFIIINILLIVGIVDTLNLKEFKYGVDNGGEPEDMATYIIENMDYKNLKFYNEFDSGSYLAYRGIPIFIDGRVEVYIKAFNGKEDIIKYYYHETPEELLKRYEFDYIITSGGRRMYNYMMDNNYEVIYSDQYNYYIFKNKEA